MKNWFVLLLFLSQSILSIAQNFRDSIDVLHYEIKITFPDPNKNYIEGQTTLKFRILYPYTTKVRFDLNSFEIKSISINNKIIKNWQHSDDLLTIAVNDKLIKDTNILKVSYSGKTREDYKWGGFYFRNGNAFNMGIAMASNPPSAGRYWFVCSDNFADKATFTYQITVPNDYWAAAGGLLVDIQKQKNKTTYIWQQNKQIPPYLASVSVAQYDTLSMYYKSISGRNIPVVVFVQKGAKQWATNSLNNLDKAIQTYEKLFGEYQFDKIGISQINFDGGAMEHAENISLASYALNGTTNSELLIYHELAHSWFGNLVTCRSPKDIWLNEGWAKYCEAIFAENVYGKEHFKTVNRQNHFYALNFSHINDDGYKAIADINLEKTYGTTIYKKGADVVHNLRSFLGDSLFFATSRQYLREYMFQNASIADFENFFIAKTKQPLLRNFFDYWLHQTGYPFYELNNYSVSNIGNKYKIDLNINQRTTNNVPLPRMNKLQVVVFDQHLKMQVFEVEVWDTLSMYSLTSDIEPASVIMNFDEKLMDATVSKYEFITDPGLYVFDESLCEVFVEQTIDTALIHIRANFIAPTTNNNNYTLQSNYYWTVEGLWNDNFIAQLKFFLSILMDDFFISNLRTKKIVLLHRNSPTDKWHEVPFEFKTEYLQTKLQKGQFAFAFKN